MLEISRQTAFEVEAFQIITCGQEMDIDLDLRKARALNKRYTRAAMTRSLTESGLNTANV